MPLSVQANMPVAGLGISTGAKRLFGGAWSRIKSMFRGAKPPPAPKVAKEGGQWLLQRPGRTTATVLANVRQTYERRAVPGPTGQPSSSVQPDHHAPEPDKTHTTTSAPTHGPEVGHDHGHTPVATPQERLVALGRELDDIEEALSRVQTLDRQARTAGTPSKKAKQLALDRRFQRAEAEKKIAAALKSLGTVRASGTQLGTSEAARLTALENRLYKALITLQLPKVGAVLDDLQRAGDEPIDPTDYPDLAGDPARVLASFDPDGSGESLLATPGRFLEGMMRSLRTLHQAGALDSDLMHRLADFGYMREWADSAFVDDNWKATDSLETQLRLLATGNEGAIDWLLGSDRTQDDRALDLKLKLSAVRTEQARRSGGPERETTVQPEGLIRARHELARAKRDLGRYLTAVEGSRWKGDRRTNQIIGRGSDVRITPGLLQAMRSKFGDKVGREVNLLIAHVMLLQRKIDALERQPTVDDLRAKLKSAQSELETQRDWETTQVFEPGDPQQLRAASLISEALALKDQLSKLGGSEPIDPDELDRMDTAQLDQLKERQDEYARTATRLEKVMQQIDDLHGKGVVAQATRNV